MLKIRKSTIKLIILSLILELGNSLNASTAFAENDNSRQINSIEIAGKVIGSVSEYINYKVNGVCLWLDCDPFPFCKTYPTLELDEYLPDFVVSVYADKDSPNGKNPYFESSLADNTAYSLGNTAFKAITRSPINIGNGNSGMTQAGHYDGLRTKSVTVTGSPLSAIHIPYLMLKAETFPYAPYYYSDLDVLGRLGIAESLRLESISVGDFIGSNPLNHWSYEFPRNMSVNVYNNFKASAIVAQRAADLVTNLNFLHTVFSTSNSCGENCVVANVIEEPKEDHEKWQMVYPNDKHIHLGESDLLNPKSLGSEDDVSGNGNYVFVLWRHYQGCVQGGGKLLYASHHYSSQKR